VVELGSIFMQNRKTSAFIEIQKSIFNKHPLPDDCYFFWIEVEPSQQKQPCVYFSVRCTEPEKLRHLHLLVREE